jgi:hypothetical protein
MKRRYIVTGDRNWYCPDVAERVLKAIRGRHGEGFVIVHGAARGVDVAFAHACVRLGIEHEPHPADWIKLGHRAGPIRNQEMVDGGAEYAIAVHKALEFSKGTKDCVRRCLEAGIAVYHVDDVHPTRSIEEIDRDTGRIIYRDRHRGRGRPE